MTAAPYDRAEAERLIADTLEDDALLRPALAEQLRAAVAEIERLTADVTAAQLVAREADRRAEGRTALLAEVERLQAAADVTRRAAVAVAR